MLHHGGAAADQRQPSYHGALRVGECFLCRHHEGHGICSQPINGSSLARDVGHVSFILSMLPKMRARPISRGP